MGVYSKAAAVVGAGIVVAAAVPTFSYAKDQLDVIVGNTPDNPVPVVVGNTPDAPVEVRSAPDALWQGTPYVATAVIFGPNCSPLEAVPDGSTLFVERVTASFNVAPGRGAIAGVRMTPVGTGQSEVLYVPTFASGPVPQTFGVYDGYQGSVDIGLPTSAAPEACLFALQEDDVRGRLIVSGYLVPSP